MNDKITVVIPVYNVEERYLLRAVYSVLAQTYQNLELLLIDDDSTNPSTLKAEKDIESLHDFRVRIIRNTKNQGISVSRNRGIEEASGEWIGFLDHDDYYLPVFLESLYKSLKNSDTDLVVGGYVLVDEEGNERDLIPRKEADFDTPDYAESNGMIWSRLYRRSALLNHHIRFPEGCYTEDSAFLLNWLFFKENTVICKARNYCYCVHDFSATSGQKVRMLTLQQLPFDYVEAILKRKEYLCNDAFIRCVLDQAVTMALWMCYGSQHVERVRIAKKTASCNM